jgi:uncharacterized protein DUF4339
VKGLTLQARLWATTIFMGDEYYYSQAGQRCGPVLGEQLKQLAASGQLQPTDLIWKEGMPGWIAAAKVKGLFPAPPEPNRVAEQSSAVATANQQPIEATTDRAAAADAARAQARQAKDAALAAGGHALAAFKALIRNPVGGLREAFELLGPTQALGAGIVFCGAFALLDLAGEWIGAGGLPPISFLWREVLFSSIPVGVAIGVCFLAQIVLRGHGAIQAAVFVAGASLLPAGAAFFLVGVIASKSVLVVAAISIFGICTNALMTYSGCTTVLRLPENVATLIVPTIYLVDVIAYRLIIGSMIGPGFGM